MNPSEPSPRTASSSGARAARAAGRGAAALAGAVVGLVGLALVALNLWISFVRKFDTAAGVETDPLGNAVPPGGASGPFSDLGLFGGDFSLHGVLITVTGAGGILAVIAGAGLLKWAFGRS